MECLPEGRLASLDANSNSPGTEAESRLKAPSKALDLLRKGLILPAMATVPDVLFPVSLQSLRSAILEDTCQRLLRSYSPADLARFSYIPIEERETAACVGAGS